MPGDELTPIFRVVRKRDSVVFPCQSAHEVAIFLWGRNIQLYDVFVRSRRVPLPSTEFTAIEAAVEAVYAESS